MVDPADFNGFEWDEDKSARCHKERGFDFDYAAKVFDGDFTEREDKRQNWGEPRFVNVGEVGGQTLVVVWTPRGTLRRIISARPASKPEREELRDHREAHKQRNP